MKALPKRAGSSEALLLVDALSTKILYTGSYENLNYPSDDARPIYAKQKKHILLDYISLN